MLDYIENTRVIPAVPERTEVTKSSSFNISIPTGMVQTAAGTVGTVTEETIKAFLAAVVWTGTSSKLIEKTVEVKETEIITPK